MLIGSTILSTFIDYKNMKKKECENLKEINEHLKTIISQQADNYNRKANKKFN